VSPVAKRAGGVALFFAVCVAAELGLHRLIPDTAFRQLAMLALVNVVVALSLNVINGMAGQFSIGHAGFVGVGAYAGAIVTSHLDKALGYATNPTSLTTALFGAGPLSPLAEQLDKLFKSAVLLPPALLVAGLLAGLCGVLVGLPSLRLKGDYLAIVTLGFAEIFRLLIATASPGSATEGVGLWLAKLGGQQGYDGPDGFGISQYAGPFWVFGGAILATIVAWRLKFSGWGRALRALREDEIAAAAVGVDPTRYKVTSFVISAVGGGLAGVLYSSMRDGSPTVQPEQFNFFFSFDVITMVILGGSGSVSGSVLGAVFVTITVKMIEQLQRLESVEAFRAAHPDFDLNALRMVVYAAVLIVLMVVRPNGLFGEGELKRPARNPKVDGAPKPEGGAA
jgi:branched-chain amino acid transport system permease protein